MRLNLSELKNRTLWEEAGFILPEFDIKKIRENTHKSPYWIHFGAGSLFRAFPAVVCQQLLDRGKIDRGIIVAEGYDTEIIDSIFFRCDNLYVCVTLNADSSIKKQVIASVTEALKADFSHREDTLRLMEIFASESLCMASFTITEKGYGIKTPKGDLLPQIKEDFENPPQNAKSYMGRLAALCLHRFISCGAPLTLVSMDNCSHNGSRLKEAMAVFGENWEKSNIAPKGFREYILSSLAFPWTMIDKITPRPSEEVGEILFRSGFEDISPIITEKNTYTAAFVNAEAPQYLIIEDSFKNGKIPLNLTGSGVTFTSRETVEKVEKMKVCTCLNPLHTALAVFGCLLNYETIAHEMKDKALLSLIKHIGYDEGLPVVTDPKIIEPKAFLDEVVSLRLPNPFIPDSPRRIACDTSQKVGVRFGETIKAYGSQTDSLKYIPLVLAGWCRYLMATDDKGCKFELSPDCLLKELAPLMSKISLGDNSDNHNVLSEILSRNDIFGVNLYEAGLGDKIERYFGELNGGIGAVRKTLDKYCR